MKNIFLSSLALLITVFILVFVVALVDSIGNDFGGIIISAVIAGVATMVASVVLLIWVIPLHLALAKFKKTKFTWYIVAALFPGFIFVYWLTPFGQDPDMHLLFQALFCSFVGVVSATVFWYFAVYRHQRITKQSTGLR